MVGHRRKPILSNSGKINHHAMKLKRRDNTTKDSKKLKSDMESGDTPYNRQDLKQNLKKDLDYLPEE